MRQGREPAIMCPLEVPGGAAHSLLQLSQVCGDKSSWLLASGTSLDLGFAVLRGGYGNPLRHPGGNLCPIGGPPVKILSSIPRPDDSEAPFLWLLKQSQ